jgi:hypothetical protein
LIYQIQITRLKVFLLTRKHSNNQNQGSWQREQQSTRERAGHNNYHHKAVTVSDKGVHFSFFVLNRNQQITNKLVVYIFVYGLYLIPKPPPSTSRKSKEGNGRSCIFFFFSYFNRLPSLSFSSVSEEESNNTRSILQIPQQ